MSVGIDFVFQAQLPYAPLTARFDETYGYGFDRESRKPHLYFV
jgi:hypothetical protein